MFEFMKSIHKNLLLFVLLTMLFFSATSAFPQPLISSNEATASSRNAASTNNAQNNCLDAPPSIMIVGQRGRVTYTDGSTTTLREQATTSSGRVMAMPEGFEFDVIGGPVCADGYNFWQLETDNGEVGWAADGNLDSYWIEPIASIAQVDANPTLSPTLASESSNVPGIWSTLYENSTDISGYVVLCPNGRYLSTRHETLEEGTYSITAQNQIHVETNFLQPSNVGYRSEDYSITQQQDGTFCFNDSCGYTWIPDGTNSEINFSLCEQEPYDFYSCGNAPSTRLVGVTNAKNADNLGETRVRSEPSGAIINALTERESFEIISGPTCKQSASGSWINWWFIRTQDGTEGYAPEGADGVYWLEPVETISTSPPPITVSIKEPSSVYYYRDNDIFNYDVATGNSDIVISLDENEFPDIESSVGCPKLSTDGSFLAFANLRNQNDTPEVVVVNLSTHQIVVRLDNVTKWFDWSPNSNTLAYAILEHRIGGPYYDEPGIWLFDATSREKQLLAYPQIFDTLVQPNWSPTGAHIAFREGVAFTEVGGPFTVANTDIEQQQSNEIIMPAFSDSTIVGTRWLPQSYDWSPDGTQVVFEEDGRIFIANLDGSDKIWLIGDSKNPVTAPLWSPDGRYIAFGSAFVGAYAGLYQPNDIRILDLQTKPYSIYTLSDQYLATSWSPDSTKLLASDGSQIAVLPIDGSETQILGEGRCADWIKETPIQKAYQYALMSKLAYEPDNFEIRDLLKNKNWFELDRTDPIGNDSFSGYFAVAYRNIGTDEVVIAHRGTNQILSWLQGTPGSIIPSFRPPIDVYDDFKIAFGGVPIQYSQAAVPFMNKVCDKLISNNHRTDLDTCLSSIIHTGHSLGAFIAEISADRNTSQAIVFDSPGAGKQIVDDTDIVNFVGPPNIVNTWNPHSSQIVLVDTDWCTLRDDYYFRFTVIPPSWETATVLYKYIRYTVDAAHNLDRITTLLQQTPNKNVTEGWIEGFFTGLANFDDPSTDLLCNENPSSQYTNSQNTSTITPIQDTQVSVSTPSSPNITYTCPGTLDSVLQPGDRARIALYPGNNNNVRENPNTGATIVGQFIPGEEFDITGEPVCAGGYRWWPVTNKNVTGWTVDGNDEEFWIEPIVATVATVDDNTVPPDVYGVFSTKLDQQLGINDLGICDGNTYSVYGFEPLAYFENADSTTSNGLRVDELLIVATTPQGDFLESTIVQLIDTNMPNQMSSGRIRGIDWDLPTPVILNIYDGSVENGFNYNESLARKRVDCDSVVSTNDSTDNQLENLPDPEVTPEVFTELSPEVTPDVSAEDYINPFTQIATNSLKMCETVTDVSQIECEALVNLYLYTGGANWERNTNWLESTTVCDWYGINCQGENITRIDIRNNNLSGRIPAQIGDIYNLQVLNLGENNLEGEIPAELGNLLNLSELYLYNNQLSGTIPPELGSLINLTDIVLGSNQLTGSIPPELYNLANLTELGLSNNQLSGSISKEIGNLTQLTSLGLTSNNIRGTIPSEIGSLENLEILNLSNMDLVGEIPNEIGNLNKLTHLRVNGNSLTGNLPPQIGNLTNLEWLSMNTNELTGSIPNEFGNLTNLRVLTLGYNNLSGQIPTELGNLTNLSSLQLASNQLIGNVPESFISLVNLTSFSFEDNNLTTEGMSEELVTFLNEIGLPQWQQDSEPQGDTVELTSNCNREERLLAFILRDTVNRSAGIYLIDPYKGKTSMRKLVDITYESASDTNFLWSPDGSKLLYQITNSENGDISTQYFLINIHDQVIQHLILPNNLIVQDSTILAWSPDFSELLKHTRTTDSMTIEIWNIETESWRSTEVAHPSLPFPRWSRDGSTIYLGLGKEILELNPVDFTTNVVVTDVDYGAVSPYTTEFLIRRGFAGDDSQWIITDKTGNEQVVIDNFGFFPSWTDDEKWIFYSVGRSNMFVQPDTGEIVEITPLYANLNRLYATPDGGYVQLRVENESNVDSLQMRNVNVGDISREWVDFAVFDTLELMDFVRWQPCLNN